MLDTTSQQRRLVSKLLLALGAECLHHQAAEVTPAGTLLTPATVQVAQQAQRPGLESAEPAVFHSSQEEAEQAPRPGLTTQEMSRWEQPGLVSSVNTADTSTLREKCGNPVWANDPNMSKTTPWSRQLQHSRPCYLQEGTLCSWMQGQTSVL